MKRPLGVTFLGCLFIVAGLTGLVYHLTDRPLEPGIVWISAVRLIAVAGGVFLLMGHGWARWLLLAWLAFHVAVSALHSFSGAVTHLVLLLMVGIFLWLRESRNFFEPQPAQIREAARSEPPIGRCV